MADEETQTEQDTGSVENESLLANAGTVEGDGGTAESETTNDGVEDSSAEESTEAEGESQEQQPEGAPESYEGFTVPEGVALNEEYLGNFHEVAKELNLTQEQAQKVVDLQQKIEAGERAKLDQQVQEWREQVLKDPGHNQTLSLARRAVDEFADQETAKLFNDSWIGNHPGVIGMLSKIGKVISEGSLHEGQNKAPAGPKDITEVLWPGLGQ